MYFGRPPKGDDEYEMPLLTTPVPPAAPAVDRPGGSDFRFATRREDEVARQLLRQHSQGVEEDEGLPRRQVSLSFDSPHRRGTATASSLLPVLTREHQPSSPADPFSGVSAIEPSASSAWSALSHGGRDSSTGPGRPALPDPFEGLSRDPSLSTLLFPPEETNNRRHLPPSAAIPATREPPRLAAKREDTVVDPFEGLSSEPSLSTVLSPLRARGKTPAAPVVPPPASSVPSLLQVDPRSGLPLIDFPPRMLRLFSPMDKEWVLHLFLDVDRVTSKGKHLPRIVFVTDTTLFLCEETAADCRVTRIVPVAEVVTVLVSRDQSLELALVIPEEYDLWIRFEASSDLDQCLHVLGAVHRRMAGTELTIRRVAEINPRMVRLDRPSGFEVTGIPQTHRDELKRQLGLEAVTEETATTRTTHQSQEARATARKEPSSGLVRQSTSVILDLLQQRGDELNARRQAGGRLPVDVDEFDDELEMALIPPRTSSYPQQTQAEGQRHAADLTPTRTIHLPPNDVTGTAVPPPDRAATKAKPELLTLRWFSKQLCSKKGVAFAVVAVVICLSVILSQSFQYVERNKLAAFRHRTTGALLKRNSNTELYEVVENGRYFYGPMYVPITFAASTQHYRQRLSVPLPLGREGAANSNTGLLHCELTVRVFYRFSPASEAVTRLLDRFGMETTGIGWSSWELRIAQIANNAILLHLMEYSIEDLIQRRPAVLSGVGERLSSLMKNEFSIHVARIRFESFSLPYLIARRKLDIFATYQTLILNHFKAAAKEERLATQLLVTALENRRAEQLAGVRAEKDRRIGDAVSVAREALRIASAEGYKFMFDILFGQAPQRTENATSAVRALAKFNMLLDGDAQNTTKKQRNGVTTLSGALGRISGAGLDISAYIFEQL